jgi:hypothetical protein
MNRWTLSVSRWIGSRGSSSPSDSALIPDLYYHLVQAQGNRGRLPRSLAHSPS